MSRDRAAYMRDYRAKARGKIAADPNLRREGHIWHLGQRIEQLERMVASQKPWMDMLDKARARGLTDADIAGMLDGPHVDDLPSSHAFNSRPFRPVPK